ncbi:MAG: hypothetical protein ACYTBV_19530 [Planctomycetota bacterium]|jgi:hypothetical protein
MAETWDETKPAGSRNPIFGDDDIREFKRAMRERLAEDHEFESTESPAFGDANYKIGKHRYVTLLETSGDKTTLENEICIIAKNLAGNPEMYIVPESGGSGVLLTRDNASKFNALSFHNSSVEIAWPTNNLDSGSPKLMVGDSNTIVWMYLNTAPPGWKALATGADMVLAVAGGSDAYNVNGGNPDSEATWTISGLTADSHTHSLSGAQDVTWGGGQNYRITSLTTGGPSVATVSSNAGWRPKASVGKLFQLDTA